MSRDKQNIKTTDWLTRGMTEEEIAKKKEEAIKEAEAELRDKQIEEMCKIVCQCNNNGTCIISLRPCDCECSAATVLGKLYDAGYRKASDVAREIFADLKSVGIDEWRYPIIAELKKKYTEEGK